MLARYTLQMFLSIGLMFYINAKLTAVLLSVVPVIAVAAVQYGNVSMIENLNVICLHSAVLICIQYKHKVSNLTETYGPQ